MKTPDALAKEWEALSRTRVEVPAGEVFALCAKDLRDIQPRWSLLTNAYPEFAAWCWVQFSNVSEQKG